jgi:FRG domain-containing protein
MAKLPEYKSLEEKEEYFINGDMRVTINIETLFEKLDELKDNKDFFFRGCSEAKYKLYNSSQRSYIGNELYHQAKKDHIEEHYDSFIESLIKECKNWNQQTVPKLLSENGIDQENALAYLSFMQHYGIPTPFLDFTFDPYTALFFAIDGINLAPSDIEIENYFSIYFTYHNATIFEGWKEVFKTKNQSLDTGKIPYAEISKNSMHILLPDNEAYKILNNTNIINQKGMFIYNNHPIKPLEETYLEFAKFTKGHFGDDRFKEMLMLDKFANCINIHKSLIPIIQRKLNSLGITNDFIYPNVNTMKHIVLQNAIANSIRLRK